MHIIAVFNPKGGCGKTTSVLNIGFGLQGLGYKVMLIDLDPSGSLSMLLRVSDRWGGAYQLIKKQAALSAVTREVRNMAVVPSHRLLAALDIEMAGIPERESFLSQALKGYHDYDYVLIDCPPGFGLININALAAAGAVIAPVLAEHLDFMALPRLLETIAGIRKHFNSALKHLGFFINRFNRRKINKDVLAEMERLYPGLLLQTVIRDNVSISESPVWGLDIFAYQANSNGALDYMQLCRELAANLPR